MRLVLLLAVAASAPSAQPTLTRDSLDARLDAFDAITARLAAAGGACAQAVPMPRLDLDDQPAPVPIRTLGLAGTMVPMPNVCAETAPLAVLPEVMRFRLAPVLDGNDLGQQVLRELEFERFRRSVLPLHPPPVFSPRTLRLDEFRQRLGSWPQSGAQVAPPAERR